jgi:hypothetical protein
MSLASVSQTRLSKYYWLKLVYGFPDELTQGLAKDYGCFPFNEKFENFRNGGKWYDNFLGKFPEIPKIVEFPKCEPFNRKFRKLREERQIERKFSVRNFRTFGYI